jgi:hypothetical protein
MKKELPLTEAELIKWASSSGVDLTNKKILAYGIDKLVKVITPSEYLGLDINTRIAFNHSKDNKCIKYNFAQCKPARIISQSKHITWDIVWSTNGTDHLNSEKSERCIRNLISRANKGLFALRYNDIKTPTWWLETLRKCGVIENYRIKTGTKYIYVYMRTKGYQNKRLFNRMAVVGNGSNDVGKGKGVLVDKFKQVIRMNNYVVRPAYISDYGQKVTSWVTSFNHDIDNRNTKHYEKIFCPIPIFFNSLKYRRNRNLVLLEKCLDKIEVIPLDYFNDLLEHIPNPSTGLAFLYWVYRENGELNDKQVFGFSFFDPKYKHHYFDDFDLCYHDGDIEQQFYEKMLNKQV